MIIVLCCVSTHEKLFYSMYVHMRNEDFFGHKRNDVDTSVYLIQSKRFLNYLPF